MRLKETSTRPRLLDDVLRMTLNGMFVDRIHLRDLTNSADGCVRPPARIRGAQPGHRRREEEDAAEQRPLEAGRERVRGGCAGGEQVVRSAG